MEAVVRQTGAEWFPIDCIGNLHTSSIELLIRSGADGVLILSCAERDCRNREGPKWMLERVYHGREAELKERVDRRRIAVQSITPGDTTAVLDALAHLRIQLEMLHAGVAEPDPRIETDCKPAPAVAGAES
jgi:coenzyme F420-reducing hydrogenase delta subunit